MSQELTYADEAAAGYDRAFGHVTTHFVPYLLDAAVITTGLRVLDVATGTGLAASAVHHVVGPSGHITAVDLSPAMVAIARQRLGAAQNAKVSVADGQSLPFPDSSFDAVICSLGLMFFPDPLRGLTEFRRVLRNGGRAAVMVNTVAERSYNNFINLAIARHLPSLQEASERVFSLGAEDKLRSLFAAAGFEGIESSTISHRFVLPSFDAYFEPFQRGAGSPGQALLRLPADAQIAVREEVRLQLGDTGGPISLNVEYRLASGRH